MRNLFNLRVVGTLYGRMAYALVKNSTLITLIGLINADFYPSSLPRGLWLFVCNKYICSANCEYTRALRL